MTNNFLPKFLFIAFLIGYSANALAQGYLLSGKDLYIGFGGGSTELAYGKGGTGYLGIGVNDIGALLYIAGDGLITNGGQDKGSGKVGLMATYNALGDRDGLNVQILAGAYSTQYYYAYGSKGENLNPKDPNRGRAQLDYTKLFVGGGVKIGYKFMEITLINDGTMMFGFKLSR